MTRRTALFRAGSPNKFTIGRNLFLKLIKNLEKQAAFMLIYKKKNIEAWQICLGELSSGQWMGSGGEYSKKPT